MGRKIEIRHITSEYFSCRLCLEAVKDPLECRMCEQLFCYECLIGYIGSEKDFICPNGCLDPVFEKAGHAFEKLMGFVYLKCKKVGCQYTDSIKNIVRHEEMCTKPVKTLKIDVCGNNVDRCDRFWIEVLEKVITPRESEGVYRGSCNPTYFSCTHKSQQTFTF